MKQIIFYIIAILGAFALYFWKENEYLAGGFVALVLYIAEKFKTNELKAENKTLRMMHKAEFRKNQNSNIMTDLEVLLAQAVWIKNNVNQYPTQAKQVLEEQIENIESVIGGGGILNQPPNN